MNAEDVALQYAQSRPGLDIVTFIEVGLPFWRLELQCTLIERHAIPPTEPVKPNETVSVRKLESNLLRLGFVDPDGRG